MEWKKIVATVAPGLATALGGPMAGVAVRGIATALWGEAQIGSAPIDVTAIEQAVLTASPEDLRKLKQAEFVFQRQMKELEVDLVRLAAGDRASARERQAKTGDKMPGFIASAALAGFFGILTAMIFAELPEGSQAPLNVMLGALGSLVVAIGNFYFGSSAGSSAKTTLIADLIARQNSSPTHHPF
ncbi:MAG: hypothetical protein RLN89_04300 [Parvibaculum sp.]